MVCFCSEIHSPPNHGIEKHLKHYFQVSTSSNHYLLQKEIKHHKHIFVEVNGYPTWVEREIAQKVFMKRSQIQSKETIGANEETDQTHMLILPYNGEQGERALRNINREIKRHLPDNKKA